MNLELIREIADLRSENLSYTEISETVGIARLAKLVSIDKSTNVVLSQDEYCTFESGLKDLRREVEMLDNELVFLNNMSFGEKLKWLFIPKEQK